VEETGLRLRAGIVSSTGRCATAGCCAERIMGLAVATGIAAGRNNHAGGRKAHAARSDSLAPADALRAVAWPVCSPATKAAAMTQMGGGGSTPPPPNNSQ